MANFSARSKKALRELHPLLQQVAEAAIEKVDFVLLDAQRGRAEQEAAFKGGFSKVHFGKSAHNYTPAVAFDLCPYPIDFDNVSKFIAINKVIMPIAKKLHVPLRWGGDWNRNGKYTDENFRDWGHYELDPWKQFATELIND